MKAWLVKEKDEFCATVVFAETRGKARAMAKAMVQANFPEYCVTVDVKILAQFRKQVSV